MQRLYSSVDARFKKNDVNYKPSCEIGSKPAMGRVAMDAYKIICALTEFCLAHLLATSKLKVMLRENYGCFVLSVTLQMSLQSKCITVFHASNFLIKGTKGCTLKILCLFYVYRSLWIWWWRHPKYLLECELSLAHVKQRCILLSLNIVIKWKNNGLVVEIGRIHDSTCSVGVRNIIM